LSAPGCRWALAAYYTWPAFGIGVREFFPGKVLKYYVAAVLQVL